MSRRVQGKNAQILLLAVVAIGMFMDSLDGSIVNIALPSMTKSFGIDTGAAKDLAPELAFAGRVANPAVFADVSPERSLKVLVYRAPG